MTIVLPYPLSSKARLSCRTQGSSRRLAFGLPKPSLLNFQVLTRALFPVFHFSHRMAEVVVGTSHTAVDRFAGSFTP